MPPIAKRGDTRARRCSAELDATRTLVITGGQFDRPRFGSWMYDRGRGVWSRGPGQAADEDAHGADPRRRGISQQAFQQVDA